MKADISVERAGVGGREADITNPEECKAAV